jgi:hypothetical protein
MNFTGKGDTLRGFICANGAFAPSQVSFTLSAGDTWARFAGNQTIEFQTGTLASAIAFTAALGDGTALGSQSFTIAPAAVYIDTVVLEAAANGALVEASGYDNTQKASTASFTFYNTSGQQIGLPITVDATAPFASYFANAATGAFSLTQAFSVTGDVSGIGKVAVTIQNAVGPSAGVMSQ